MDNSSSDIIYKLKYPIQMGSEEILELKFVQPKLKHLKKLDGIKGDIAQFCKLLEILCNLTPMEVDEISPLEIPDIQKVIQPFLPNAPQTS